MKTKFLHKKSLLFALLAASVVNLAAHNGVKVSAKMFLKGALEPNGLMRDDLRSNGQLPSTEPYTGLPNFKHYGGGGGETISGASVSDCAKKIFSSSFCEKKAVGFLLSNLTAFMDMAKFGYQYRFIYKDGRKVLI